MLIIKLQRDSLLNHAAKLQNPALTKWRSEKKVQISVRFYLLGVSEVKLTLMCLGMFALITPVITSTVGCSVERIICIPTCCASWARRTSGVSMSRPAFVMKSVSSSITTST